MMKFKANNLLNNNIYAHVINSADAKASDALDHILVTKARKAQKLLLLGFSFFKNKHQINTKIDITKAFAECEGLILLVTHRGIEPRTY